MKTTQITITPTKLKEIMSDYVFDYEDIFNYDDETSEIFEKLENLDTGDKIIFVLYCESQSLRKVAKILGVSYSTVRKAINEIKTKLIC